MNLNFPTSFDPDAPHRVPFDRLFLFWSAFPTPDRRPISQCRLDAFEAGHNHLVWLDLWSSSLLPVKQNLLLFKFCSAPSRGAAIVPLFGPAERGKPVQITNFCWTYSAQKYKEPAKRAKKTEVPLDWKNPKLQKQASRQKRNWKATKVTKNF